MSRRLSLLFGAILALLGALGFVSNPLIGTNAIFAADTAHNLIHIILGAVLLGIGLWRPARAEFWLKVVGAITFLMGLIGLLTVPSTGGSLLGLAYTNGAIDWFHVIIGLILFFALMVVGDDYPEPRAAA